MQTKFAVTLIFKFNLKLYHIKWCVLADGFLASQNRGYGQLSILNFLLGDLKSAETKISTYERDLLKTKKESKSDLDLSKVIVDGDCLR